MTRTIIYARVSTEDQMEKYGMQAQLRACRDYATAHGFTVIEEITDDGISGAILDRPGLARVRLAVAEGRADVVLMLDADRLSRELAHLLILKPEIERKARLEFVAAKFEDSPSGRMFFGMRGVIAQYERELVRERTTRGRRERAMTGLVAGNRVAYGYRYESGRLIPDEDRAASVRQIFEWYLRGLSIREVTLRLRMAGVPTWGGRQWGRTSVRRILANETYAGVAYYGVYKYDADGRLVRRTDAAPIAISVPALVEREQWERVQARLAENPQAGRPSSAYLLRGLLFCSCGRKMAGNQKRRHLSYRCLGRDRTRLEGTAPCVACVNARKLDAAVWTALLDGFTDASVLRNLLAAHRQELEQSAGPEQVDSLRQQARKLKAREERVLSLMADPDLAEDRSALKAKYLEAQRERRAVEAQLSAAEASIAAAGAPLDWLDETVALLREYLRALEDPADRQAFVRGLITRAEWDGRECKLHCLLGSEIATSSGCNVGFRPLQLVLTARLAA